MVLVEHPRPQVALITLNRPERMNSMAFDVMVPLKEALENITYDNSVRVVVLTGAGKGFSSGADHKSAGERSARSRPDPAHLRAAFDGRFSTTSSWRCDGCTSR